MKELIIGTSNPAKIGMVQSALLPLDIKVRGTKALGLSLNIIEGGQTAQENARKKSLAYAEALGRLVLSIDNALYLEGLPNEEQPGINTRKVAGMEGRASDQALLDHYSKVIERLGGETNGHWEFAVCIADGDGRVFEKTIISPRRFVATPSSQIMPGYPLESLQIDLDSGKYISEMNDEEQDAFWQKMIGEELCRFVSEALFYEGLFS